MAKKSDTFSARGDLTSAEVPGVYRDSLEWKKSGLPGEIDLSGVERCDSSALALLLEWSGWAEEQGQTVRFTNPPDNLLTISQLSEAGELLGFPGPSPVSGSNPKEAP